MSNPGEPTMIADALVLTALDGLSLRRWRDWGMIERDWAIHATLGERYGRIVVVSYGDGRDHEVAEGLGSTVSCICNEEGLKRAAFVAGVPARVAESLGGCSSVLVRTDQMAGGDAALGIARRLRGDGLRVGLVARGGYPRSRFAAWEFGAGSSQAAQAAAAEGRLCRNADVVVGTTRSMIDDLCWRHGIEADRTRLVPNYVLDSRAPVEASGREAGLILFAGRLEGQKRLELLIDAVGQLPADLRARVRLAIIGEGSRQSALRARAGRAGIDATFEGRLPHADLIERMERCAIYAQASGYEGHPKAVLEAMGTGAALLVADAPGLRDVVQDGVTGLVAPGEPEALARALERLLRDPDLRARLGGAASKHVRKKLALERIAELEADAQRRAMALAGSGPAPTPGDVLWEPTLLDADPIDAARAFAASVRGYARRLEPDRHARFAMALDRPIDEIQNWAAMDFGRGVHPKHDLMGYHDFFVERIAPGQRVIDLGCGYGAVSLSIAQRSRADVTGMDLSSQSLAQAREAAGGRDLADRVRFLLGDITETRAEGRFDVIVLSNVLEHIASREHRLRTWVRWYEPGRVLIRVPAFDRDWKVPFKKALGLDWRGDPTHETEYTERSLRQEMGRAGLVVTELIRRWGEFWLCAEPG